VQRLRVQKYWPRLPALDAQVASRPPAPGRTVRHIYRIFTCLPIGARCRNREDQGPVKASKSLSGFGG
jgi:hypothetical protein